MKSRSLTLARLSAAAALAFATSAQAVDYTVNFGDTLSLSNGSYTSANLLLQGGTVSGSGNYNAYGASVITGVTVSGSAASTITGSSWFNLGSSTTFTVADATGNSASDLLVNLSLRSLPGSPDTSYLYDSKIIKEGAGTMEVTVHSYFNGGLDLNNGTLKVSGGNGGYGFFAGTVNVNSGTTLTIDSDGTGFGYQGGCKPTAVNIVGGTVNGGGHIWGISGGINMTGGTLDSSGGFQWNYTNLNTLASATTATVSGPLNLRGDGGYTTMAVDVADGAAATDLLISGNITETYGPLGITKSGAGTMELTGTNSYTGATTVSGGKLLINGSNASATGAVTVASGASLGGSGTVGGATTIQSGGHLAVGNGVGSQTFSSSLDLQSGSIFDWDLAGNTTSGAGTNFDSVSVTGTLTIASDAVFRVIQNTGLDFNDTFWDSTRTWSNIFSAGTLTSGWSNAAISVYNTSNVLQDVSSYGSFTINGTSLTWTAVPEPTSALAGLLLTAGLLRRRRVV